MRFRPMPAGLVFLAMLTACGQDTEEANTAGTAPQETALTPPPAAEPGPTTRFWCGETIVDFTPVGDNADLAIRDETYRLPRVQSGSGAKYEAGNGTSQMTFWTKEETALLSMGPDTLPECLTEAGRAAAAVDLPFSALGQEPGWRLEIGTSEATLRYNYGEDEIVAPTPVPEILGTGIRYTTRTETHRLVIDIVPALCRDVMSGMPFPHTVQVELDETTLAGCGGTPTALLTGEAWQVEDIDGGGIIDNARVTLEFSPDGRLAGRAGCNRFTAPYTLSEDGLNIGPTAATKMACPEALMTLENTFLEALGEVRHFDISDTGALRLRGAGSDLITARRQ